MLTFFGGEIIIEEPDRMTMSIILSTATKLDSYPLQLADLQPKLARLDSIFKPPMSEANQTTPYKVCTICFYGITRFSFSRKSPSQGRQLSAPSNVASPTGIDARYFVKISSIGIWSLRKTL